MKTHLKIQTSLQSRLCLWGMACSGLLLSGISVLPLPGLILLQIVACLIWGIAYRLSQRKTPVKSVVLMQWFLPVYAILAVYHSGWNSGFEYYLLISSLLLILYTQQISLFCLHIGIFYTLYFYCAQPVVPTPYIDYLYVGNVICVCFLLAHHVCALLTKSQAQLDEHSLQAHTDCLTQLPNRRGLLKNLANVSATATSLVLVDIDHFKQINDRYGHDVGDHVLFEFALFMRQAIRAQDIVGRWGGEEFLIILPQTSTTQAHLIIERLRHLIEQQLFYENVHISATFGISAYEKDVAQALRQADKALYKGKMSGRNQICTAK